MTQQGWCRYHAGRGGIGYVSADRTVPHDDSFYTVHPCRVFDTRTTNTPIQPNTTTTFAVGGLCGVPLEASAVACNATLVPQGTTLDLGIFPGDLTTPANTNVVSVEENPLAHRRFCGVAALQ